MSIVLPASSVRSTLIRHSVMLLKCYDAKRRLERSMAIPPRSDREGITGEICVSEAVLFQKRFSHNEPLKRQSSGARCLEFEEKSQAPFAQRADAFATRQKHTKNARRQRQRERERQTRAAVWRTAFSRFFFFAALGDVRGRRVGSLLAHNREPCTMNRELRSYTGRAPDIFARAYNIFFYAAFSEGAGRKPVSSPARRRLFRQAKCCQRKNAMLVHSLEVIHRRYVAPMLFMRRMRSRVDANQSRRDAQQRKRLEVAPSLPAFAASCSQNVLPRAGDIYCRRRTRFLRPASTSSADGFMFFDMKRQRAVPAELFDPLKFHVSQRRSSTWRQRIVR